MRRLETDDSGRTVTGVVVSRDGNREVYLADIVAVSAGAADSAKLLLNSASDAHPHGLAVNPALTAMANALRVGDHIRQRLA